MDAAREPCQGEVKVALTTRKSQSGPTETTFVPAELSDELRRMRQNATAFTLNGRVKCRLGCGKGAAYNLRHPQATKAGTWCALHGWIFFDSVKLLPTEGMP